MKLRYKISLGFLTVLVALFATLTVVTNYDAECLAAPTPAVSGDTMRAVRYHCYGPPEILNIARVEKPVPGDDEVLVAVRAAGVNPLDWHYMRGSPNIMRLASGIGAPKDHRLGVDFAGIVEAVGNNVSRFAPGDRVFGGGNGAYAEYLLVREDRAIAQLPDNVSYEQAASVAIAATTALQALRDKGGAAAGQRVLINGASGGVGTFAVQIAKHLGAEVTGVCSTRNVDMVRSIGADHVIDYKQQAYVDSGEQFDLIIDNVGNFSLLQNRRVMADGGTLVRVGGPSENLFDLMKPPLMAMLASPFISQKSVGILAELRQEDLEYLAELMGSGTVAPVIDRHYPLQEIAEAMSYSESGRARGKIIIDL